MFYIVSLLVHNFLYGSLCIIGLYCLKNIILERYGGRVYLSLWILPIFSFFNPISINIGIRGYYIDDTVFRNAVPAYRVQIAIILGILFAVSIVLFIKYLYEKGKMKKTISVISQPAPAEAAELMEKLKLQLGIKRFVEIRTVAAIHSPLIIFIKHPVIFLPQYEFNEEQLTLIIKHELWHLKRWHVVYKELANLVHMVFWWNPLTYNMLKNVSEACEFACDQLVLSAAADETKAVYVNTITDVMEYASKEYHYLAYFNSAKGMLKRLELMKKSQFKKCIAPVVLGFLMIIGNVISFRNLSYPGTVAHLNIFNIEDYKIVEQYNGMFDVYQGGELIAAGVDDDFLYYLTNMTGGK